MLLSCLLSVCDRTAGSNFRRINGASFSESSRDDSAGQGARPGDVLGVPSATMAAVVAGAGAKVDDPVGADHYLGAVLDDDHRMTPIHQRVQGRRAVEAYRTGAVRRWARRG